MHRVFVLVFTNYLTEIYCQLKTCVYVIPNPTEIRCRSKKTQEDNAINQISVSDGFFSAEKINIARLPVSETRAESYI